jgi:hypothetical protein
MTQVGERKILFDCRQGHLDTVGPWIRGSTELGNTRFSIWWLFLCFIFSGNLAAGVRRCLQAIPGSHA